MSDTVIVTIVSILLPALVTSTTAAIVYLFKAVKESGRAESYKIYAEGTITSKNAELDAERKLNAELISILAHREGSQQ